MEKRFWYQLYACSRKGFPENLVIADGKYELEKVFKHDFFAATGLYRCQQHCQQANKPRRIILKIGRQEHFLGLPLLWLGEMLCSHEMSILRRLADLSSVPHLLSRYGRTGFVYEYIEGSPLDSVEKPPEGFFDELSELVQQVHQRNIVYLDMNKRSNIILGSDGKPYLIDFQISFHVDPRILIRRRPSAALLERLQKADLYHLLKHKRKMCPELLSPNEKAQSRSKSWPIRLHRLAATPLRRLRRDFLKYLHAKGRLLADDDSPYAREDKSANPVK